MFFPRDKLPVTGDRLAAVRLFVLRGTKLMTVLLSNVGTPCVINCWREYRRRGIGSRGRLFSIKCKISRGQGINCIPIRRGRAGPPAAFEYARIKN